MKSLFVFACRWFCAGLLCTGLACAQDVTLTARVELLKGGKPVKAPEAENVVVWLVPEGGGVSPVFHQNHEKRLQVARQFFQAVVNLDESFCVLCGDLLEFRLGSFAVCPPGDDVSVGEGNLNRRIAGDHAQAVFRQA